MIKNLFKQNNYLYIVDVVSEGASSKFLLSKLLENRGEVEVVYKDEDYESLELIKEEVKQDPIIALFVGDKIIYSKDEVFKSFSEEDFYKTTFETEKQLFNSIVRREYVNEIVEDFLKNGLYLVKVSIGGFETLDLYKTLFDKKELRYNQKTFRFHTESLGAIDRNKEGDTNEDSTLFKLGTAIGYYHPSKNIESNFEDDRLSFNHVEVKNKRELVVISKYAGAVIVGLFLISSLLSFVYKKKNNELNNELTSLEQTNTYYTFIKNEKEKKERVLKTSGLLNPNYISYYINEIASSVSSGIKLTEVTVFPAEESRGIEKKIVINDNIVVVKGELKEIESFYSWIGVLKERLHLDKLDVVKYNRTNKNKIVFEIEMTLTNEF